MDQYKILYFSASENKTLINYITAPNMLRQGKLNVGLLRQYCRQQLMFSRSIKANFGEEAYLVVFKLWQ